jgi:hypothetical protein
VSTLLELAGAVAGLSFAWWLARAIFIPERPCRWCHGSGRNWWSNGERRGPCLFCGGEPWRMTRGARAVRRVFRGDQWGR